MNKKKPRKNSVLKTRNANTMTESAFWGMIRQTLRGKSRFWKPRLLALSKAKRKNESNNKRLKWEFQCNACKKYFPQKNVEVHHSIEAGSLKCANDLPGFVERLFAEDGWVVLCRDCHHDAHTLTKF